MQLAGWTSDGELLDGNDRVIARGRFLDLLVRLEAYSPIDRKDLMIRTSNAGVWLPDDALDALRYYRSFEAD